MGFKSYNFQAHFIMMLNCLFLNNNEEYKAIKLGIHLQGLPPFNALAPHLLVYKQWWLSSFQEKLVCTRNKNLNCTNCGCLKIFLSLSLFLFLCLLRLVPSVSLVIFVASVLSFVLQQPSSRLTFFFHSLKNNVGTKLLAD